MSQLLLNHKMKSLQEEVRKRRPFELAEEEAYLNLLRTHETLYDYFSGLFKPYGISQPQYNVLRILRGMGGEGVRTLDLIGPMVNRVPDITRLVDRLERAGLVSRHQTKEDRRVVLVRLSEKGLALLDQLDRPVRENLQLQLGDFSDDELMELNRLLLKARYPERKSEEKRMKG